MLSILSAIFVVIKMIYFLPTMFIAGLLDFLRGQNIDFAKENNLKWREYKELSTVDTILSVIV